MLINEIVAKPPTYIDEYGNKFWLDIEFCKYAANRGLNIRDLQLQIFIVQLIPPNEYYTWVIVEKGQVIHESQVREDIACYIDFMSIDQNFNKKHPDLT